MNKKLKLLETIGVISLALIVSVLFVRADWIPPTTFPTACPSGQPGCDVPINTSSNLQNKLGSLGVSGLLADMIKVGSSGIEFADGTIQTTAAAQNSSDLIIITPKSKTCNTWDGVTPTATNFSGFSETWVGLEWHRTERWTGSILSGDTYVCQAVWDRAVSKWICASTQKIGTTGGGCW